MSRLQNYPRDTRKLFYVGIGRVENTVWIIYRSPLYNGLWWVTEYQYRVI